MRSSSVFACSTSRPCSQSLGGVVYPSRNCPLGINVFHIDYGTLDVILYGMIADITQPASFQLLWPL